MKINKIPSSEQKEAIKFCMNHNRGIVCYGTGTGKSLISLSVAKLYLKHHNINSVFIIGTQEALKSLKKELSSTFMEKSHTIKDFKKGYQGIIFLKYGEIQNLIPLLNSNYNYVCIFDEFHKLKTSTTKITKISNKLKLKCKYRYGFTATPIMKDIKDLYNLVKWMNPLLLDSWEMFCKRYTMYYTMTTGKGIKIIKPYKFKNFDKLRIVLKDLIISYFPEYDIKYIESYCKLEDVNGYRDTIKTALSPTGDDDKDKALPMLAVSKAKNFVAISKSKLIKLLELVNDLYAYGVIIYCDIYHTLNPIYKLLTHKGYTVLKYTGKQTDKQNDESMQSFINSPKNKILLLSRVAGASLNLQVTNHLIMFDMPSSIGTFQQLMGRVARKYSKFGTYYIYLLLTKGSVEEYWFLYLTMFAEPLKNLFNNGLVPTNIPTYNEFIKKQLLKDAVWNK